uniref:acylglycerol lipase n=1 Tax=Timema tahoe TaxID=61484 RepID=A0A7R9IJW1_9NEOP|nr:unnamed protein product [Timema tahoe]
MLRPCLGYLPFIQRQRQVHPETDKPANRSVSDPDVLDFGGLTQIFQVEQDGFLTCETNDNNSSMCALIMSPHAAAQKTYQSGQPEYKKHSSIIILDEDKRESTHTKPLLYFLHGVGSSADLWTGLVHHFTRAGFECVAPDMLGHGYSAAPDQASAYTFTRMLKDTLDIFDQYVGSRKCVVIGHAYGCSLAAAVARYRCEQVGQLVLISGGGPTPLAPRTADSKTPALPFCLQICLKPLLMCGFRRKWVHSPKPALVDVIRRDSNSQETLSSPDTIELSQRCCPARSSGQPTPSLSLAPNKNLLYAPCGKHINSNAALSGGVPQYVLHHVAHGQDWPEGDSTFHRRILVPTLIVHGMQDPYVTLVQECEMERKQVGQRQLKYYKLDGNIFVLSKQFLLQYYQEHVSLALNDTEHVSLSLNDTEHVSLSLNDTEHVSLSLNDSEHVSLSLNDSEHVSLSLNDTEHVSLSLNYSEHVSLSLNNTEHVSLSLNDTEHVSLSLNDTEHVSLSLNDSEHTIPRSFLEVIPNAGHLPMLETPSQLSHMIHCFIDWWS